MPLLLVLNELSYQEVKARRAELSDALHALVSLLRRVRRHRDDVALVTERRFMDLTFSDDFSVRQWAADSRNRDAGRYLKALRNRAPVRDVVPAELRNQADYFYEGRPAVGIGSAYLLDGLAISLQLEQCWDTSRLSVVQQSLEETDRDVVLLVDTEVMVRHVGLPEHVDTHQRWIVDSGLEQISTGGDLWSARADLLPHLRFLLRVEQDLRSLTGVRLRAVKERLAELELVTAAWSETGVTIREWPSKVTPEGETRKRLCWFTDEVDGGDHLFDLHARFTPGAGRLHFRLDYDNRRIVIGYIGPKLE